MKGIRNFLNRFFDSQKPRTHTVPFLHESIDLKSLDSETTRKWKSEGGYESFAELVLSEYRQRLILGKSNSDSKEINILDKEHSNGWHFKCSTLDYKDKDYKMFAYFLAMKLKELGYVINVAEQKSTSKTNGVEMITHYYLKPSLRFRMINEGGKVNQLHGNISIQYKVINGNPESFMFLAKSYSDSNYQSPLEFNNLIYFLFDH